MKNSDLYKYKYSSYGIGFHSHSEFLLRKVSLGKNIIIFGADMRLSVHIDNKGKDTLILVKGWTQGLNNISLINSIYFT